MSCPDVEVLVLECKLRKKLKEPFYAVTKVHSQRVRMVLDHLNLLSPNSDQHQISPHHISVL